MALFVTKYVTTLMVFVLGLKAPGIMTSRDYFNLNASSYTIQVGFEKLHDYMVFKPLIP